MSDKVNELYLINATTELKYSQDLSNTTMNSQYTTIPWQTIITVEGTLVGDEKIIVQQKTPNGDYFDINDFVADANTKVITINNWLLNYRIKKPATTNPVAIIIKQNIQQAIIPV